MCVARFRFVGVLLTMTLASTAAAQGKPSALSFGIAGGLNDPVGNADSFYAKSYQLGGLAELRMPVPWIGVRLDGGYQRLGGPGFAIVDSTGAVTGDGHLTVGMFSAPGSLTIRVPNLQTAIRPYVLAGLGRYWLRAHSSFAQRGLTPERGSVTSTSRLTGSHAGLGLEAPLTHAVIFAEARYQSVGEGQLHFVPISVGLRVP